MKVEQSHVLVTGAARGIGRAIAQELVRKGAKVTLTDVDVGLGPIGLFHEVDPDTDERGLAVNLHGVLNGMRVALPGMLARGRGHIVNVASGAAFLAVPGGVSYAAAKAGVRSATESVRVEYRGSGLGFTGVYPGFIDTSIIAGTRPPKLFPPVPPEVLGRAVVRAVERGKPDVFVPRMMRAIAYQTLLGRRARYALNHAVGLHSAFVNPDEAARASYNERMRSC